MNPLLLDRNPHRQPRYRPTLNRPASRYALNSDMEGGCPCPLGGNGCDPCFEVNIAQRMALGHGQKVIEGEGRCRSAYDRRSRQPAHHTNKDATPLPPRYNGRFCDSVSRRAEFLPSISPTDQLARRDSCNLPWHPISSPAIYRTAKNTHG